MAAVRSVWSGRPHPVCVWAGCVCVCVWCVCGRGTVGGAKVAHGTSCKHVCVEGVTYI